MYLWTRTVSAAGVSVTYQPVARFGTPSGLDVTIPVAPGAKEVAVTLPDAIAGGFDLQSVTPRPTRWEPGDGAMRLAFTPMPDARCPMPTRWWSTSAGCHRPKAGSRSARGSTARRR